MGSEAPAHTPAGLKELHAGGGAVMDLWRFERLRCTMSSPRTADHASFQAAKLCRCSTKGCCNNSTKIFNTVVSIIIVVCVVVSHSAAPFLRAFLLLVLASQLTGW